MSSLFWDMQMQFYISLGHKLMRCSRAELEALADDLYIETGWPSIRPDRRQGMSKIGLVDHLANSVTTLSFQR